MNFKVNCKGIIRFIILGIFFIIVACNSDKEQTQRIEIDARGKNAAIDLCDCMTKNGHTSFDNPYELKKAIEKCALNLLLAHGSILQLESNERKKVVKSLMHAFIETDCMDYLTPLINSEIIPNID